MLFYQFSNNFTINFSTNKHNNNSMQFYRSSHLTILISSRVWDTPINTMVDNGLLYSPSNPHTPTSKHTPYTHPHLTVCTKRTPITPTHHQITTSNHLVLRAETHLTVGTAVRWQATIPIRWVHFYISCLLIRRWLLIVF